jgi:hypothetical protein
VDDVSSGSYNFNQKINAVTDTGTTMLHLPAEAINGIANEIGAKKVSDGYAVPCSKQFSIDFKINGHTYKVPSKEVVVPVSYRVIPLLLCDFS